MTGPIKKAVEEWLNEVKYTSDPKYVPSSFAIEFVNFIKLVNGEEGEEHKSPVLHYHVLDNMAGTKKNIANMMYRGSAKTSLVEYLFLYLAVFNTIPGFGTIEVAIYVSDSIENGVKNMRKNLEHRYENSDFMKEYVPKIRFTDTRWEFINSSNKRFIVKAYGARALSLDSTLYTQNGLTTIGKCQLGDKIFGADGKLATIIEKSDIFNKPMYKITLADGRSIKVSEDHINSVVINTNPHNNVRFEEKNLTTKELLNTPLIFTKPGNFLHKGVSNEALIYIKNCKPLVYLEKKLPIDPYTVGLILGDGSVKKNGSSIVITGLKEDYLEYKKYIPYELGIPYLDKRTKSVLTWAVKGINQEIRDLNMDQHGDNKFIPEEYFYGSIDQRLSLLQGLMDTDGSAFGNGRLTFSSNSPKLSEDVASLVRSLGGKAHIKYQANNRKQFTTLEIWINKCPFKLPRKAERFIPNRRHWDKSAIVSIDRIPDEPSQCIAIDNEEHQFLTDNYFRTHNTGVRGTKELGTRPNLCVLDDILSDEDARSPTVISSIEDTVYKAVNYALHPTKSKTIWNGTPFNSKDPLYKAVESGAWYASVYPICEQFPCKPSEFKGAWPDRFPYSYVLSEYNKAVKMGKIDTFNQELMLRIMSDEERLVQDGDLIWYRHKDVLDNRGRYNFYITTDFATTEQSSGDFSVISVWALNNNGDWLWVDGIVERQLMDKNIDSLFRLVQEYKPLEVGVEVSGQQKGFISWIQKEMGIRNIYFNLASDSNNSQPGIRPNTNKMQRFSIVLPWFKQHKIWFPEERRNTPEIQEAITELSLACIGSFKSKHEDFIDTISMLPALKYWRPSAETEYKKSQTHDMWEMYEEEEENDRLNSYIV